MKMNRFDKLLLSIFMWLGTKLFSRSYVGYDANDTVVTVGFMTDEYYVLSKNEIEYAEYERKQK
jgi:hypothetical protein